MPERPTCYPPVKTVKGIENFFKQKPRQICQGFIKIRLTYYPLSQLAFLQQPVGLQTGLQGCSVHCLLFNFLGLLFIANAPVANEHTSASITIFFILLFLKVN